jgi:hypothetical protein
MLFHFTQMRVSFFSRLDRKKDSKKSASFNFGNFVSEGLVDSKVGKFFHLNFFYKKLREFQAEIFLLSAKICRNLSPSLRIPFEECGRNSVIL